MDGVLTRDECELLLENYSNEKGDEIKLTSYTIKPLSGSVEGFIGEHYAVLIEGCGLRFFLKVLNGSEVIFKLSESLGAYEKEEFFYTCLRKAFREAGVDLGYSPEAYLCKPYKIILEDVSVRGYRSVIKGEFFDVRHCEVGLMTLAKFHASGIIYENLTGSRLDVKFPGVFKDKAFDGDNDLANKWLNCSFMGILGLIDYLNLPQTSEVAFKEKLETAKNNIFHLIKQPSGEISTLIHGDVWLNNFLFSYDNEKPVDGILIDYQLLKYGHPALDVLQFIYSNTRKSLRDFNNTYTNLLKYYYKALKEILASKQIILEELMREEDFLKACDLYKATVKLLVIADRSTTLLSGECFASAGVCDDSLRSFLFENRTKLIIEHFQNNEKFREIIQEDLMESLDIFHISK